MSIAWLKDRLGWSDRAIETPASVATSTAAEQQSATPADGATPEPASPRPIPDTLTDDLVRSNLAAAEQQGVTPAIHPKDFIYWFCVQHVPPTESTAFPGIDYYFWDGARSATKLAEVAATLDYERGRPIKLLEFASGYGCVSRHLKTKPEFDLVSCDIHPEAIDFLTGQIGVQALLSSRVPEQFSPAEKYDMVFALSFFSHMPRATWGRWLRALFATLNAPGYLVFTTHGGRQCDVKRLPPRSLADGFWFAPSSEQKDLDTADYGDTIAMPNFVIGEIYRQTEGLLVSFRHAAWWDYQDVWIVKRER